MEYRLWHRTRGTRVHVDRHVPLLAANKRTRQQGRFCLAFSFVSRTLLSPETTVGTFSDTPASLRREHVRYCRPRKPASDRPRPPQADGRRHCAPRPRRPRNLDRHRRRRRFFASAPGDPRPVAPRPAADALRRWPPGAELQRRNLQPWSAAGRAGGGEGVPARGLARAQRYRDPRRSHRRLGARGRHRQGCGHVRLRLVGPGRAGSQPGARPVWGEAAILRLGGQGFHIRFGTQVAAPAPGLRRHDRPPGARPVRGPGLCAGAALDLPQHLQARAGLHSQPDARRSVAVVEPTAAGHPLLVIPRRGPRGSCQADHHRRRGDRGA